MSTKNEVQPQRRRAARDTSDDAGVRAAANNFYNFIISCCQSIFNLITFTKFFLLYFYPSDTNQHTSTVTKESMYVYNTSLVRFLLTKKLKKAGFISY